MPEEFRDQLTAALAGHRPTRTTQEGAREAAVLIPVVGGARPRVIFTVRTDTLPNHKGQISFPGGSIDAADDSPLDAALRETQEEIGLDPAGVTVVGELDTFPTYVTGYLVTPFVGFVEALPELEPNPAEVAEVLLVPLDQLSDRNRREPGFIFDGQPYPTEAWIFGSRVIWGVTARIIRLFLDVLADAGLADRPGRDPWSDLPPPGGPV